MKNRAKTALILVIFLLIQLLPWALVASPIFILGAFDFDLDLLEVAMNDFVASQTPYTFELNSNGTYTVTGIERTTVKDGEEYQLIYESLIIPSTHEDKPVTVIGNGAFFDLEGLKSISLPRTVVKIDANAFSGCDSLERIELPNGVRYIGDSAFSGCHSLKTIKMPERLNYLGEKAFYNCRSLYDITIPDGITEIRTGTFAYCFIKSIEIPEGVTTIGASAFYDSRLESVSFPEGLITIEDRAFDSTNLTSLDLPDSVRSIGFHAFAYAPITEFTSPASLETTGDAPFWYCHKLKTATFNSGTQKIYHGMFYCCSSLTDLYLPADVEKIETYAFLGCTGLRRIHFAGSTSEWESIEKEDQWNSELKNCYVICTNGEIRISK
ncbi:MAG: leucine-rich repeat protein [Clostridia bacterium]|nr:leucine-rich repeat protein [Clostridia bacterium]